MKLCETEVESLLQTQKKSFEMEGQEARQERSVLGQRDSKEIVEIEEW